MHTFLRGKAVSSASKGQEHNLQSGSRKDVVVIEDEEDDDTEIAIDPQLLTRRVSFYNSRHGGKNLHKSTGGADGACDEDVVSNTTQLKDGNKCVEDDVFEGDLEWLTAPWPDPPLHFNHYPDEESEHGEDQPDCHHHLTVSQKLQFATSSMKILTASMVHNYETSWTAPVLNQIVQWKLRQVVKRLQRPAWSMNLRQGWQSLNSLRSATLTMISAVLKLHSYKPFLTEYLLNQHPRGR